MILKSGIVVVKAEEFVVRSMFCLAKPKKSKKLIRVFYMHCLTDNQTNGILISQPKKVQLSEFLFKLIQGQRHQFFFRHTYEI